MSAEKVINLELNQKDFAWLMYFMGMAAAVAHRPREESEFLSKNIELTNKAIAAWKKTNE